MVMNLPALLGELRRLYPEADCTLEYDKPWQLLFNTRLAAQCTDARVNMVAVGLYARYPMLEDMADADLGELEALIRPTGFYHNKASDLKSCAQILLNKFAGQVPDTMDALLSLPGIGRKTANLMLGELYRKPAVVTDTHCIRLSNRFGLVSSKDPYRVELTLRAALPESQQLAYCHRTVCHGRAVCRARKPDCPSCTLKAFCPAIGV